MLELPSQVEALHHGLASVSTARMPEGGRSVRLPPLFAPLSGSAVHFATEAVVWAYEGPPQWALRVLLKLVHPQHPHAPVRAYLLPTPARQ
jgi:hypothetical protein